jgi:hypothetical protein
VLFCRPSGSGKSTRIVQAARDLVQQKVPVFLLRFRNPGMKDAAVDTSIIAQRVFAAIDYPPEPSYVEQVWGRIPFFDAETPYVKFKIQKDPVANRVGQAFQDILIVAKGLYAEREADPNIPEPLKKPVVFADELHDVLRHPTLGLGLYKAFLDEVVFDTYDSHKIRVVVAKSGGGLRSDPATKQHVERIDDHYQPDADLKDVRAALAKVGHEADMVEKIVTVCGGRVGLLHPFLRGPMTRAEAEERLKRRLTKAAGAIVDLKKGSSESKERKAMKEFLDAIASSPPAAKGEADLPVPFQQPIPKGVLYVGEGERVLLQSEAVRQAWLRERKTWP